MTNTIIPSAASAITGQAAEHALQTLRTRYSWNMQREHQLLLQFLRDQDLLGRFTAYAEDRVAAENAADDESEADAVPLELLTLLGYAAQEVAGQGLIWVRGIDMAVGFDSLEQASADAWRRAQSVTAMKTGLTVEQLSALPLKARDAVVKVAHGSLDDAPFAEDVVRAVKSVPAEMVAPCVVLLELGYRVIYSGDEVPVPYWQRPDEASAGFSTEKLAWLDAWDEAKTRAAEAMGFSAEQLAKLDSDALLAVVQTALGSPSLATAASALEVRWAPQHPAYHRNGWRFAMLGMGCAPRPAYWAWVWSQLTDNGGFDAHDPKDGVPLYSTDRKGTTIVQDADNLGIDLAAVRLWMTHEYPQVNFEILPFGKKRELLHRYRDALRVQEAAQASK